MYLYRNTKVSILKTDITRVATDAIVNAANNRLLGGGGVDGAIHRVGGIQILNECRKIGRCQTGEACITTGGNLPCKKVIHTVGPIYKDGNHNESQLLYNAYYNSLKLAEENQLKRIAFPSISTGVYGYPIEEAAEIAIKAVKDYIELSSEIEEVIFVLFSYNDYEVYKKKIKMSFQ